jgi:hypothetical protein
VNGTLSNQDFSPSPMTPLAHMQPLYYTLIITSKSSWSIQTEGTNPYSAPLSPQHPFVEPGRLKKGKTALRGLVHVADQRLL